MNHGFKSLRKSVSNSLHYNGAWATLRLVLNLVLVKLNLRSSIRLSKFCSTVHLRNGSSDIPVFRQIFLDNEYALNIPPAGIKTIIDGGSNIGLAAVYFARLFPEAKIIGIEPDENNYQLAVKNTKALPQVKLIKAGLWSKVCMLKTKFDSALGEWGITVEDEASGTGGLQAFTIDHIMNEYKLDHIDILKLDVEGAEYEIFSSANPEWIRKTRYIVIELHDYLRQGCSKQFYKALADSGIKYSSSALGENIIIKNESFSSGH